MSSAARFPAPFPLPVARLHSHEVIYDVILMRQPHDVSVGGMDAYHLGNSAATGGTISSSFQLRCALRLYACSASLWTLVPQREGVIPSCIAAHQLPIGALEAH
jgi:hypothetical protein